MSSLTKQQAREILTECLNDSGIHDAGSVRLDLAAEHFAQDINAAEEAEDLDRVPAWFIREPYFALALACFIIAAVAFGIAWLIH